MLVQSHDTGGLVELQALSLVGDPWTTEVVPRLPPDLAEQARALRGCLKSSPGCLVRQPGENWHY